MEDYHVLMVVDAVVPAENAGDALHKLGNKIRREGIGPDDKEREWSIQLKDGVARRLPTTPTSALLTD